MMPYSLLLQGTPLTCHSLAFTLCPLLSPSLPLSLCVSLCSSVSCQQWSPRKRDREWTVVDGGGKGGFKHVGRKIIPLFSYFQIENWQEGWCCRQYDICVLKSSMTTALMLVAGLNLLPEKVSRFSELSSEFCSFFLSWVSKTQPNHWTKRMANTRLAT